MAQIQSERLRRAGRVLGKQEMWRGVTRPSLASWKGAGEVMLRQ